MQGTVQTVTASAVETSQGQFFSCSRCKSSKPRDAFAKDKSRASGVQRTCKECASSYQREWSSTNREKHNEIRNAWRLRNHAAWRAYVNSWVKSKDGWSAANTAKRRAALATPKWADLSAIKDIYRRAKELTKATGIKHTVDHIVPLQGEDVCGLHVEYNLQILTASDNSRKHNRYEKEL